MDTLTVTPEIQVQLAKLNDVTELWDKDGHFIGLFTPKKLTEEELNKRYRELFDLQEARRLLASNPEKFTTEQVVEHLNSLEKK